jgi:Vi polysaccharide biosynthesis protein TviD
MISVTCFGTCRIHNPLKRLANLKLIKLNNSSVQAYVHSTEEILQQIRFIKQSKLPPKILWNWIIGENYRGIPLVNDFEHTDVFIVEISSTKVYKFQNYILKPYQIESIVENNQNNSSNEHDENTKEISSEIDQEIIHNHCYERQTQYDVKKGMNKITSILSGKVVFVTHINSLSEQGHTLPSRENLIKVIETHGKTLESVVFNPTNLINKYGQSFALKDNGQDLNHYNSTFCQIVACHMFENYLVK